MSLSVDGVWKAGVWATTVWAEGVWREGTPPVEAVYTVGNARIGPAAPLRASAGGATITHRGGASRIGQGR